MQGSQRLKDQIENLLESKIGFSNRKSTWLYSVITLAVLSCILSAIITTTSLRQPNAKYFNIPVNLSKPNTYRTDFQPSFYSLGIEFILSFDDLYEANRNLKDFEAQITLSDKTGQVLLKKNKTRNNFSIHRIDGIPKSLRTTLSGTYGLKKGLTLEFKVIKPAIGLDDKGQHLTAYYMRTGMELAYAFYLFIIGMVFSLIAVVIIKRLYKSKLKS